MIQSRFFDEYEVGTAKDGIDALEKLHERVPDLMLLDIEMPRLELALGHPVSTALLDAADGNELFEKVSSMLRPYVFLTLNTYVNGQWTPGTTLSSEIPPCQRSSVKVSAIAGYKLSVLGMVELSDNKLLWEKDVDRFKDDKPCTLTGS